MACCKGFLNAHVIQHFLFDVTATHYRLQKTSADQQSYYNVSLSKDKKEKLLNLAIFHHIRMNGQEGTEDLTKLPISNHMKCQILTCQELTNALRPFPP